MARRHRRTRLGRRDPRRGRHRQDAACDGAAPARSERGCPDGHLRGARSGRDRALQPVGRADPGAAPGVAGAAGRCGLARRSGRSGVRAARALRSQRHAGDRRGTGPSAHAAVRGGRGADRLGRARRAAAAGARGRPRCRCTEPRAGWLRRPAHGRAFSDDADHPPRAAGQRRRRPARARSAVSRPAGLRAGARPVVVRGGRGPRPGGGATWRGGRDAGGRAGGRKPVARGRDRAGHPRAGRAEHPRFGARDDLAARWRCPQAGRDRGGRRPAPGARGGRPARVA